MNPTIVPAAPAAPVSLRRPQLFAALFVLGCANGLVARATVTVHSLGWRDALLASFDISAIVLVACAAGLWLVAKSRPDRATAADLAVCLVAVVLIAVPIGGLSWLAVSGLALYILRLPATDSWLQRGAAILLAVTVPALWSRLLFQFFANLILEADAALVSWLIGTARTGNIVRFVSGEGNLVIFPACSSLANMSLAVLAWVTISQWVGHRRSPADLVWVVLACLSVMAINVIRLGLMATNLRLYEAVHSQTGDAVAGTLILAAVLGCSFWGVRRDLTHRP